MNIEITAPITLPGAIVVSAPLTFGYASKPEGASTFAELTDKATADLPAINTALASALSGKAAASHTHVSADITDATSSATGNTIVRRTSDGDASFTGLNATELAVGGSIFQASSLGNVTFGSGSTVNFNGTTYNYAIGGAAALAHRTALGSGATGDALFTAATPAAARTTLELGSTDSPTFATLTATKVTSATSLLLSANLSGVDSQRINLASAGLTRISIFTNNVQRIGIQNAGQIDISSTVVSTSTVTASNFKRGTGSPESVVTGVVGDLYARTDGGAGTTLYVKESGTGNTGWVAK